MNLTPEQEARTWQALEENDASGLSPEETHFFAEMYEWHGDHKPLFDIIRNPQCEKATACLIYWIADPIAFYNGDIDPEELDKEVYALIKEIEQRYVAGFYTHQNISLDPEDEGASAVGQLPKVALHVPKELIKPIQAQLPK